jgi:ubiquitin-like modifier-activating enzyme ATG7
MNRVLLQAPAPGQLLLFNTLEAMRRTDKAAALQAAGRAIWADIVSGAAERQPQLLLRFLMLAYGDLKHFVFDYW